MRKSVLIAAATISLLSACGEQAVENEAESAADEQCDGNARGNREVRSSSRARDQGRSAQDHARAPRGHGEDRQGDEGHRRSS